MHSQYCPRIHHGLALRNISNDSIDYAVCCWAKDSETSTNVVDFYTPGLQTLRQQNKENQLPESHCKSCIEQELVGKKSMRLGYAETHGVETYKPSIQYLDIQIDYTCNLACVTCGPEASTTWRNELKIKKINVRPNLDNFLINSIDSLDLSDLKEIRIYGGEPFLTHTHRIILEHINKKYDTSNIKLMYNTNGTCRIDDLTRQLIEKYKFARISFSIDGIGDQFEYLRYPAKWQLVEENLQWWKHNLPHNSMLSLTVTASILNVLDLNSVFNWHAKHFSQSKFGDPIEIFVHQAFGIYGLETMPDSLIENLKSINDYCQPWIQKINILGTQQHQLNTVIDAIRQIDQRRGLDFAQIFPITAQFINYQK